MKPSRAHTDAGWNDPPKFSYNESIEHTRSPKRNILNKRVAFPLNSDSSKTSTSSFTDPTAAPCNNPNLPPPPTTLIGTNEVSETSDNFSLVKTLPIISDLKISEENPLCDTRCSDVTQVDLNELMSMLDAIVEEKRKFLNSNNKEELIKKKFQVMRDSWESNKISDDMKKRILELTNALKDKNKEKANEIQVALMVDHPKVCSEFISAFRQLINAEESNQ